MVLKVLMIWVFPATPLRSAAGRYVPGSASAPASSASPAVAAYGALHIANTGEKSEIPIFPFYLNYSKNSNSLKQLFNNFE